MTNRVPGLPLRAAASAALIAAIGIGAMPASHARVVRIVIDAKTSPAFPAQGGGFQNFGTAGQYETLTGRAFGELDPRDPRNALIQDIALAPRNERGKVEYVASFQLVKPVDMSRASGLMWHDVPNRGGRITIVPAEQIGRAHV